MCVSLCIEVCCHDFAWSHCVCVCVFQERMLSMVLDKDPEVAVEVVNLLLLLQQ